MAPSSCALRAQTDDGKLSFEEFKAYFSDGILTTEELQELFYSIDGRQTNNLDTDKLSDYFSQHLGEYLNVLSALEKLNVAILKAMDKTKEPLLSFKSHQHQLPLSPTGHCFRTNANIHNRLTYARVEKLAIVWANLRFFEPDTEPSSTRLDSDTEGEDESDVKKVDMEDVDEVQDEAIET
ncbi:N-terminal EF-hand calcium-binding protein 1 isoform X1 [Tachysurus ichikawai]